MNLLIAVATLLIVTVHTVPAPQHTHVFRTESLYPHYAFHQHPFPFNPYPNPFSQSAYVQHPLALNETIKNLGNELKTLQDISAKSSATPELLNAKSAAVAQTKFATTKLEVPKVDQNLKIIGETDHGTINIVNPFIAGAAKTLNDQPENTSENGSSQGNGNAAGDDFLKGLVPFSNSNLDSVFGPEIASTYEIHYVPEHLKFEDVGNFFPFAGPDFTSFGIAGLPFPNAPKNDQSTSQPSTNEPFTPANEPFTPANEPFTPANEPFTPANEPFTPANESFTPANDFPGNDLGTSTNQPDYSESTSETTTNNFNSGDRTSTLPDFRLATAATEKPAAESISKSETDSGVDAAPFIDSIIKTGQSSLVGGLPSFA